MWIASPLLYMVLVVDDEPAIRALVSKIIERAGLPVDTARDGAEAIEKLEAGDYSVIVLDLMMPNVDGFALIDYLASRQAASPTVIVVSAGDSALLRQLPGAMVHSIVRKPFDIDVLGDLVVAAAQSRAAGGDKRTGVIQFPNRREDVC